MSPDEAAIPGDEGDDLTDLLSDFESRLNGHWGAWTEDARDDFGFVALDQWDDATKTIMEDQNRVPITFDRINPTIDAVTGAEVSNRQEVSYQPRQVGASGVAELETGTAKWVREECDAEHEESEAFRDMLICGMGWTETRKDEDALPDSKLMIERVDPTEVAVDPASRKRNCADARFLRRRQAMSRREFDERWPDESPDGPEAVGKRRTVVDPDVRYHNGPLGDSRDEVYVSEFQWWEMEDSHYQVQGRDGELLRLSVEDYEAQDPDGVFGGQKVPRRRVYYRAFMGAGRLLPFEDGTQVEELMFGPDQRGSFTYKCMTGKRDRNKGTWFGLLRSMKDPQRFGNKFISQINHILATNAKAGVIVEEGAVDDVREFEADFAASDAVTWVKSGGIAKIQPKPATPYPTGLDRLMEMSFAAVQNSTGVNPEFLGLVDREQPGVLEAQRKQAAYGLLSTYFDSLKLYRKDQGRLLLTMMQEFLPQGTLARLEGEDGNPQYVQWMLQPGSASFDIIVDDAPAGPNQKIMTYQMLLQMIQTIGPENVPPDVWPEVIRNSPLPTAVAQKLISALQTSQAAPPTPQAQLAMAGEQAKVQKVQADTAKTAADTKKTAVETALLPQDHSIDHAVAMTGATNETHSQILARQKAVADALTALQPGPSDFQ